MTEHVKSPEPHEQHEDLELIEIGRRLDVVIDVLGYEETDEAATVRAAFVDVVEQNDGYDPAIPEHELLLDAYYATADRSLADHPNADARLGFEVALLKLWLDCREPYEFHQQLDRNGDRGVATMLRDTPGLDACLVELLAIVDDLDALQQNNFPAPKHRKPKVGF